MKSGPRNGRNEDTKIHERGSEVAKDFEDLDHCECVEVAVGAEVVEDLFGFGGVGYFCGHLEPADGGGGSVGDREVVV